MAQLSGMRIAFLVAQEGVEEVELTEPWKAVERAGGSPDLVAPERGEVQAFNHLDKASKFSVDATLADASPQEYDGVVLPGGVANPDQLRTEPDAISFLRQLFSEGKPVGVISSRKPEDLPAFCAKIVEELAEGPHEVADAGATAGVGSAR